MPLFNRFFFSMNPGTILFGTLLALLSVLSCRAADHGLFPIFELPPDFPNGEVKLGYIDETGAVVRAPAVGYMPALEPSGEASFSEGLEPVSVGLHTKWPPNAYGYIDKQFNLAIEPQFEQASPFSEGLAAVAIKKMPWLRGYIDHTGKWIIEPQFDQAGPFSEGLAFVETPEHLSGYIDKTGRWIVRAQYTVSSSASYFHEGLAAVGRKTQGNPSLGSSPFIWGYIDKTGRQVIDYKFLSASSFNGGLALVRVAEGYGYIDCTGAFAIPPCFALAWPFTEGLARVQTRDGAMSYINPKGDIVFTIPHLDWADPFSDGLANASLLGKSGRLYGYLDHQGHWAIPPQFEQAQPFVQGLAKVAGHGEHGYIDKTGRYVWKTKIVDFWAK